MGMLEIDAKLCEKTINVFPIVCRYFQRILNYFSLTQRKGSHRLMGKVWAVLFVRL